jgi:hypothetical protein
MILYSFKVLFLSFFFTFGLSISWAESCDCDGGVSSVIAESNQQYISDLTEGLSHGVKITIDDVPWIGRLYSASGDHACTAILISPEFLLTAAHCTDGIKDGQFKWKQVGHFVSESRSAKIYHVPKKSGLWGDDWAIYKLEKPIEAGTFPVFNNTQDYDLESSLLLSVGYPKDRHSIFQADVCKYKGKGVNKKSFVTDCPSKPGMSGGPILGVSKTGELVVLGIRSGPQSGILVRDGTREIRSDRFIPFIEILLD